MSAYRILVLTDHHTHTRGESIYELLRTMALSPECKEIYLASRGTLKNRLFFENFDTPTVCARRVDNDLRYSDDGAWFATFEPVVISEFDVLFLRLDRPLTDDQLIKIENHYHDRLIINKPTGIIETGSKEFLLNFPDLCPEIALCHNLTDVSRQMEKFPIVLKPVHGYGGIGLIRIDNEFVFIENKKVSYDEGMKLVGQHLEYSGAMLSMKYLKNVARGDKRVLAIGESIQGAILRIPAQESWLCNLKQGGSAVPADVDESERQIFETIHPILKKQGVLIFGFDTLVDDNGTRRLSEINTLDVGGFLQAQELSGAPVIKNASKAIWKYIVENV